MNIYEYIDYSLIDKFKPTIQWMQENYDKANRELFNGRLRGCKFEVSNLGLHTLGRFNVMYLLDICILIDEQTIICTT